ncbi:MAG: dihydropteroate synthase [Moheibacter sp.]
MLINCKGKLVDLSHPKIMGILNVTPDSFFEDSRSSKLDDVLRKVEKMLPEGADFIDVGGMSTRPDAIEISEDEELKRVIPVMEVLIREFPELLISIDTYRSRVVKEAVGAGAAIVNDISAGNLDAEMFQTISELHVPYILMHMQGAPQTMQKNPQYENITLEINQFFANKVLELRELGINDVILDPGFGFGKTIEHNYELFQSLNMIGFGDFPILVGISRKSMITKFLNISNKEALNGTTVLNALALERGAKILRVHDVKEAKETVKIWEQIQFK